MFFVVCRYQKCMMDTGHLPFWGVFFGWLFVTWIWFVSCDSLLSNMVFITMKNHHLVNMSFTFPSHQTRTSKRLRPFLVGYELLPLIMRLEYIIRGWSGYV